MNKLLAAALTVAILAPSAAFAVDKSGVVKNWFLATRTVVLADNTECVLAPAIQQIPATLAVGKEVTLTYTTAANVNTCSAIAVK